MNLNRKKIEKIYRQIDNLAVKGKDNKLEYFKYVDDLINKGDYGYFEQTISYFYKMEISNINSIDTVKRLTWENILFQTTTPFLKKLSSLYKSRGVYQNSYDIYSNTPNIQTDISQPLSTTYSVIIHTPSINASVINDNIVFDILNTNLYLIQISSSNWVNGIPTNIELIKNINVGTQSSINTNIFANGEYLLNTYESGGLEVNYKLSITRSNLLGQIKEIDAYTQDIKYLLQNKLYAMLIGEVRYFLEVQKNGTTSIIVDDDKSLSFDQNLLNRYSKALDILIT